MATNPLQHELAALQRLVDFAENDSKWLSAMMVESGPELVMIGPRSRRKACDMSEDEIRVLRLELRDMLRAIAGGDSNVGISTNQLHFRLGKRWKVREGQLSSKVSEGQLSSAVLVDGLPRDVLLYLAIRVLTTVAIKRLQVCPDADCGKAFVRVTKKRFCSQRCQARIYMRQVRAQERAERDALTAKKRKRS